MGPPKTQTLFPLEFILQAVDVAGMSLTIYTSGNPGVEAAVEHYCRRTGLQCVVYIPPCHPRANTVTPLSYSALKQVRTQVLGTAYRLQRPMSSPLAEQYLCSQWLMIQEASLVLVFGYLDDMARHVHGNGGWCVEMAKTLHKPLYVFDLRAELWCWWNEDDQQFQDQDRMSERWIQPPTLQDKTVIAGPKTAAPPGVLVELQRLFSLSSTKSSPSTAVVDFSLLSLA